MPSPDESVRLALLELLSCSVHLIAREARKARKEQIEEFQERFEEMQSRADNIEETGIGSA